MNKIHVGTTMGGMSVYILDSVLKTSKMDDLLTVIDYEDEDSDEWEGQDCLLL